MVSLARQGSRQKFCCTVVSSGLTPDLGTSRTTPGRLQDDSRTTPGRLQESSYLPHFSTFHQGFLRRDFVDLWRPCLHPAEHQALCCGMSLCALRRSSLCYPGAWEAKPNRCRPQQLSQDLAVKKQFMQTHIWQTHYICIYVYIYIYIYIQYIL